MDSLDRKIVELLQKQGRVTNVEMARMNDVAPSSMLERVRRLEERGVIKNYRAVLDPKALGYQVQAMVMLNLDRHQAGPIELFEERIRSVPEVKACYHLTGRYDYMVHLVVRDIDHLGELVKHSLGGLAGLEKQETFLVLSTVKDDEGYFLGGIPKDE
ncbi:MAG: Lrp/AsnC family transcriptional regulator [Proteobacteria bacterium]|nr:Lrp/AsnC family transcriptional regulator [Pseudomonadota bacterium]